MSTQPAKIALRDVRPFDGHRIGEPTTVVLDAGLIGGDERGAQVVDGGGAVLLPGLIDAHVHLQGPETLRRLAEHGVTTGLDMASWPADFVDALRGTTGAADIRSAGTPGIGPSGPHNHIPGMPAEAVLHDPAEARRFVRARVAEGSDYIKIVLEAPGDGGPDRDTAVALVEAAHEQGEQVVAHASTPGAWALALDVGADIVTHTPLGAPLAEADIARAVAAGTVAVPTLAMMEGIATAKGFPQAYEAAPRSVGALHRAGVPVLAGTDANTQPGSPSPVPHGSSLHHELELLVAAGLTPLEALRAATSLPARYFGLADRGSIAPGLRADLVLVDGDPLADITATRALRRIWCAGIEVEPAA